MHDLVLHGGSVYDGLGSAPVEAHVAIDGDLVVAVGADVGPGRRMVDVAGLAVAPGFVDPHAHSDMVHLGNEAQPFKLLQGVTTEVVGNCGFSFAPLSAGAAKEAAVAFGDLAADSEIRAGSFADFLARLEQAGPTNNVAVLVGHNTLRLTANGMDQALRPGALDEMCRLADEAFAAGAAGLSTGLIYVPGAYSSTEEIVALATVAHRWGRPYTTHMRDEGPELGAALDEAIEIGRRARVAVQISHCKAAGRTSHGKSVLLLDKLHEARIEGIDVRGDQYPYLAGATFLVALLPPAAQVGGVDALRTRMADPSERARLRTIAEDMERTTGAGLWRQAPPEDVLLVRHRAPGHPGQTLAALSGGRDPWEALCDIIADDPAAMMVVTLMAEDDVRAIMADTLVSIGSDSGVPHGLDHPRTWGCFPQFLGRYVRELGAVSWAEAVRKMTSASTGQFGLRGRGWLGAGSIADICVFDPQTIGHAGTYLEPSATPTGVKQVVLAGEVVVADGEFTGARVGRVLRAGGADSVQ